MILLASVFAVVLIVAIVMQYQAELSKRYVSRHGHGLVRVLSEIPFTGMASVERQKKISQVLANGGDQIVYVSLVDTQGRLISETKRMNVAIPEFELPSKPHEWFGESSMQDAQGGTTILEYRAPLIEGQSLVGYVRLGYYQPGFNTASIEVPILALLALPVFLLTPLAYFFLNKSGKPLLAINAQLDRLINGVMRQQPRNQRAQNTQSVEKKFDELIDYTEKHIHELQENQDDLLISSKLLSYKKSRVEAVLQAMPEGMVILDEENTTVFINNKMSGIIGVEVEEALGKKITNWCDNSEVVRLANAAKVAKYTGAALKPGEFNPVISPDKCIRVMSFPLISPSDKSNVTGSLLMFRDITLEALAIKNRAEFVAHVAHELKSPLNVLSMYSEALMGEDGKSEDFRTDAINVIHDETQRITTLINNLLHITRFEIGGVSIRRTRVKLRELLQGVFADLSRSDKNSSYKFILDVPEKMTPVSMDKALTTIAITNLLTNAVKYNKPNGKVILQAEETDELISIKVIDTGIGIAEEDKDHVFEKFYRSQSDDVTNRPGHGLGLALAKEIVELHLGSLTFNSVVGEGTEFLMEFKKASGLTMEEI